MKFYQLNSRSIALPFLIAVALFSGNSVAQSDPREEIRATIEATQIAIANGVSPAEFSRMLYSPDIIEVGEGLQDPTIGIENATTAVADHWASIGPEGLKNCELSLADYPGVFSETIYASFVVLRCKANPPKVMEAQNIRCLYVWKKLPQGWRVAMFQWGLGNL
jgi:ketosteroid isomerase-like protein